MKAILLTSVILLNTLIAVPQSRRESNQNNSRSSERRTEAAPTERRSTSTERVAEPRSNTRTSEATPPTRTSSPSRSESHTTRPAERTSSGTSERRSDSYSRPAERTTERSSGTRTESIDRSNSSRERSSGNSTARPSTPSSSSNDRSTPPRNSSERSKYDSRRGSNNYRTVERQTVPSRSEARGSAGPTRGTTERRIVYSEPRARETRVVYRHVPAPRPIEVRRVSYPYRAPVHVNIVWTNTMYRNYSRWYPHYTYWNYPVGYRIPTISAYDAMLYPGEVSRVYGQVHEVYYSYPEDDYYLYFGAPYPHHDFSIVVPGREARRFSRWPERYFEGRHLTVTGLITFFEERPEIIVKRSHQISFY